MFLINGVVSAVVIWCACASTLLVVLFCFLYSALKSAASVLLPVTVCANCVPVVLWGYLLLSFWFGCSMPETSGTSLVLRF